jgi:hypothetical protein
MRAGVCGGRGVAVAGGRQGGGWPLEGRGQVAPGRAAAPDREDPPSGAGRRRRRRRRSGCACTGTRRPCATGTRSTSWSPGSATSPTRRGRPPCMSGARAVGRSSGSRRARSGRCRRRADDDRQDAPHPASVRRPLPVRRNCRRRSARNSNAAPRVDRRCHRRQVIRARPASPAFASGCRYSPVDMYVIGLTAPSPSLRHQRRRPALPRRQQEGGRLVARSESARDQCAHVVLRLFPAGRSPHNARDHRVPVLGHLSSRNPRALGREAAGSNPPGALVEGRALTSVADYEVGLGLFASPRAMTRRSAHGKLASWAE